MNKDHRAKTLEGFGRQAQRFARSPLHRNPARLKRLFDFTQPQAGERALDVACGPGIVTTALSELGLRAIGVDLTAEMIAEARATPRGAYLIADATRLPVAAGRFGLVISRNSLHHIPDPDVVMGEMARVLQPGGRLIVEDMRAPDDPAKRAYHEMVERLRDISHARTLTAAEVRSLAVGAGLIPKREMPGSFEIDFEEWIERAFPAPEKRARARAMMEACLEKDLCGLRVWRDRGRLKFERRNLLFCAVRR